MPKARLYEFEGVMRTIKEVCQLVPRYKVENLRRYLKLGFKSRQEILSHETELKSRRAKMAGVRKSSWHKWTPLEYINFNK